MGRPLDHKKVGKSSPLAAALARQAHSNRSVAGHEGHFAAHRARLTHEIASRAPAGGSGRLCLLGAGNANDVDLAALLGSFREVHLVDIDSEAVGVAVGRLTADERPRVKPHAPVDVSGIFGHLEGWSRTPPTTAEIARLVEAAPAEVAAALPGPFDVVVSCCLLTQLQLVLLEIVGDRSPRFDELRTAMSTIHVRALLALLAPRGVALLVTDLTASETYPFDALASDVNLTSLMGDLLAAGNVIHAAHPGRLSAVVRRDPTLASRYDLKLPIGPWLWHNGPDQTYLVYAIEITPRAAET
jgi:hypothetical protein